MYIAMVRSSNLDLGILVTAVEFCSMSAMYDRRMLSYVDKDKVSVSSPHVIWRAMHLSL